jgi:predicted AAA+ superfamily ATPase
MDVLIEKFNRKLHQTDTTFVRSLMDAINWNARLIGIKGARGVGKTTLMLQRIKKADFKGSEALYVSLDNIWFSENKLSDMADDFVKKGGKFLFLDEVHKYANWSQEIKNMYDDYPGLSIVFTGSSLLHMLNARADLSRRAVVYEMQGLSYREFLNMKYRTSFTKISLSDVCRNHLAISHDILSQIRPLQYFQEYLTIGYYPFFIEEESLYHIRLEEVVNMILEVELPQLRNVNIAFISKIKQLLQVVAESAPFVPNILKLSERLGINRETLLAYLHYINEAHLINIVYKKGKGISKLQKPDKIFLENTNLMYTLCGNKMDSGNARETYFVNQLGYRHKVELAEKGDFTIDEKIIFEIGGKNKSIKQLEGQENAYLALDNIEFGTGSSIPLWQFGFLY